MTMQQHTGNGGGYPTRTVHAPVTPRMEPVARPQGSERAMGEIVAEIVDNTQVLVRNEIALGITQLERKAEQAKIAAIRTTAAGVAGLTGFVILCVAAILALDLALALWLSTLIVGAVLVVVGYAVMPHGSSKNKEQPRRGGGERSHGYHASKEARS